jgi:3-oxoacyl-[acyl-carrier protein] reductase
VKLSFPGNHALILGGSCRLGRETARLLADADVGVTITCRNHGRIAEIQSQFDPHTRFVPLDFNYPEDLDPFMVQLEPSTEMVVDLVHGDLERLVGSVTDEEAFGYFQANVAFRAALLKRLARHMLGRRRGRLVYVSSTAAGCPNPGQGFYAAAKLACEGLYRNLGIEMAAKGISAVIVRPGYVDAGRGGRFVAGLGESNDGKLPSGWVLTAGQVAGQIVYLLSEQAQGLNATVVTLDGGLTASK